MFSAKKSPNRRSIISDYFRKVHALVNSLATMGNTLLPDKEVVTYLLNGLGSSFEPLITFFTTRTKPLTSHELFQLLLIHESCNRSTISSLVLFMNFNPSSNRDQ